MKQSDFKHIIAPVAIGLSGDQIYFTIQALYNPRGEGFFRLEPIHHQVLMASNRLDELFHRFSSLERIARAHQSRRNRSAQ